MLLTASGCLAENSPVAALREQILQRRSPPLTNLDVRVHLNVRDFGAVPNDGKDDRSAVAAAVAKARSMEGPVQIDFEPGTYDFMAATPDFSYLDRNNAAISLMNCTNLIVDGHGAEILIHRQDVSFAAVNGSTSQIIRNFSVDYDPLPFSQGTVRSVDTADGSFVFELQSGFPTPDGPFFKSCNSWGMLKDIKHPGRLKADCPNVFFYKSVQSLGGNGFRFKLASKMQISNFTAGDAFAVVGRSASIGRYLNSDNITFDHITAYACPGPLYPGVGTSRLNILNCRAVLKDSRLLVSGADGILCLDARIGPWVENCDFEGLSDDCFNICTATIYVLNQLSPVEMRVAARGGIQPGDPLIFFNPQEGRIIRETSAKSFSGDILVLNDPVPMLSVAPPGTPMKEVGWKKYDQVYNLNTAGNYFVYRNNHMHDGRRFGFFTKAGFGLVTNNRFEGLSDQAIRIANDPQWSKGFAAGNVILQSNQISNCGYAGGEPCAVITGLKLDGVMTSPIQKNIFLLDNVFHSVSGPAMKVSGVSGLTAEGNTFDSGTASGPLVTVQYSDHIVWTNNFDQSRVEFRCGEDDK